MNMWFLVFNFENSIDIYGSRGIKEREEGEIEHARGIIKKDTCRKR